jgi:hypothetical protein
MTSLNKHASQAIVTGDAKSIIAETAKALAAMQRLGVQKLEDGLAELANTKLHERDTGGFMICADMIAKRMFYMRYYPAGWGKGRSDMAVTLKPENLHRIRVDTHLYGFHRGSDLGYEDDFGRSWYIVLGDSTGFHYVPVEDLKSVKSTRY